MSSKKEVGCDIISEFCKMAVRHQNELKDLIAHLSSGVDLMDDTECCQMSTWAATEIAIACSRERDTTTSADEWDYGVECYKSAMRAYESLLGDGHSGFSIGATKNILISLIDGRPLTPIDDVEDQWVNISEYGISKGMASMYQNTRYSALFKEIYDDGTIKYKDVGSHFCIDIKEPEYTFRSSTIQRIMDDLYPITLPYYPQKKITVYVDCANEAFGIIYTVSDDGTRTNVYKYFQEKEDGTIVKISRRKWSKIKMFGVESEK